MPFPVRTRYSFGFHNYSFRNFSFEFSFQSLSLGDRSAANRPGGEPGGKTLDSFTNLLPQVRGALPTTDQVVEQVNQVKVDVKQVNQLKVNVEQVTRLKSRCRAGDKLKLG